MEMKGERQQASKDANEIKDEKGQQSESAGPASKVDKANSKETKPSVAAAAGQKVPGGDRRGSGSGLSSDKWIQQVDGKAFL